MVTRKEELLCTMSCGYVCCIHIKHGHECSRVAINSMYKVKIVAVSQLWGRVSYSTLDIGGIKYRAGNNLISLIPKPLKPAYPRKLALTGKPLYKVL